MLSLLKGLDEIQPGQGAVLAVGFVTAFVVAWIVVAAFMRFIQHHRFTSFAIYRIIIGGAVLVVLSNGGG
jgi:undecaprenyl-diphosphatase